MKWHYEEKKIVEVNDKRIRTFFALFPVFINGDARWLEKVMVRQQYNNYRDGLEYFESWDDIEFVEEEQ